MTSRGDRTEVEPKKWAGAVQSVTFMMTFELQDMISVKSGDNGEISKRLLALENYRRAS